jgi:hypothetical protein
MDSTLIVIAKKDPAYKLRVDSSSLNAHVERFKVYPQSAPRKVYRAKILKHKPVPAGCFCEYRHL